MGLCPQVTSRRNMPKGELVGRFTYQSNRLFFLEIGYLAPAFFRGDMPAPGLPLAYQSNRLFFLEIGYLAPAFFRGDVPAPGLPLGHCPVRKQSTIDYA
jgi:hypothetical protein